ncbi:hypothetical protein K2Z83_14480 [Oscillochloris sp. ZM17-4]|uniref:hypothetical protein n=1 Tax=Oscillochloris sp. ZM17-4 TaxID=2866714 RepID=UPI001C729DA2|nr:hypothetical protein [Oscillochloris sp. ZM17-4]MBX0328883.1 hypothetical protein [Oscillochloris sp. ZM17-4]
MRRSPLLPIAILILLAASTLPATGAQPTSDIYLPLVVNPVANLEVVITAANYACDDDHPCMSYPGYIYVIGYVRNLTDAPLYNVVLVTEETNEFMCWGGNSSHFIVKIIPELTAVLPGQINPFAYGHAVGKSCDSFNPVSLWGGSTYSPDGLSYYPLTVMSWQHDSQGQVSGTVRNDSGHTLTKLRVAIQHTTSYETPSVEVAADTLAPGASTSFSASDITKSGTVMVVGQGTAAP